MGISSTQLAEFIPLLLKLRKKLFRGQVSKFGVQKYWIGRGQFQFDWLNRNPSNQDFQDHFFRDGINHGNYIEGALGFVPLQSDGSITKVTIDCDEQETRDFCLTEVSDKCDQLGIDYFMEHGGNVKKFDRLHMTILTDGKEELVKKFFRQFFGELGEPILGKNDEMFFKKEVKFDEIYGVNQVNRLCRFIYGFNAKPDRNKRYPCEYKGDDLDDVISVMKAILDMKPLSEDFMKGYLKDDFFPVTVVKPEIAYKSKKFRYQNLNLPIEIDYLPEQIKPLYSNCQALNSLMTEALSEGLITDRGQKHHDAGFALAGTFRYADIKFNDVDGKSLWDRFKKDCDRTRSDKGHNWWHGKDKEAYVYVWSCQKYDQYYGRCDGCPFKGRINSPRDLLRGIELKRVIKPTTNQLVSITKVRTETFPEIKDYIKRLIKQNQELSAEKYIISE